MLDLCLLPQVAKQPLLEKTSFLGILLFSVLFIVRCGET